MNALSYVVGIMLALAACSSEPGPEDPLKTGQLPSCAEVWKVGEELPGDYEGCMEGEALVVVIQGNDGRITYDDRLVAKPGEKIEEVH